MDEQYKIQLGVDVQVDDIKTQIDSAKIAPIKLNVEIENLDKIKQQLQNLGGTKGDTEIDVSIDATSVKDTLKEVSSYIKQIKDTIGTLDSKSGMKSLLSSINQISSALDKTSDKFDELNASMNALASKDFSLNIGVKLGGSNSVANNIEYGNAVRNEIVPKLRKQVEALVKEYSRQTKTFADEQQSFIELVAGTKFATPDLWQGLITRSSKSLFARMENGDKPKEQMEAYKEFIEIYQQAAKLKRVDLSSALSGFSETPNELIKSAQEIQTGAKQAKESVEQLQSVFGGVDAEGLGQVLEPIITDLREIKEALQGLSSGVSLEGLTSSFDRLSETIEKLVSNVTLAKKAFGDGNVNADGISNQTKAAQETANAYREVANEAKKLNNISIDISNGNVNDLKSALKNLKIDDASIENATKELTELNIVAKNVSGAFRDGNLIKFDIKGVQTTTDGLERAVIITKTLGKEGWASSERYSQSLDKIAIAAEKVNKKLKSGDKGSTKFDVEIGDVETKFNNLSIKSEELRDKIDLLKQEFANMQTASAKGDLDALIAANEKYEQVLEDVNNQLTLNKQAEQQLHQTERQANEAAKLTQAKKALAMDMDSYLKNNTAAAKEFGDTIKRLRSQIDACDNEKLNELKAQFQNVKREANLTLNSTQSFGDKIKKQWQQYSSYLSVASMFQYGEQALRSMFEQVKLIDSAMTELKKVTNETDAAYKEFLTNAATRSREIGTTIDGLVSSTADFARLGYGFEDAQGLAEVANIYAVVGDEIEGVEGATESLISTMAAFKDEMNGMSNTDFAMNIIDKFNEIGNNFAISSGGIGEALERSASSLMAANNTIDESIALITAAM